MPGPTPPFTTPFLSSHLLPAPPGWGLWEPKPWAVGQGARRGSLPSRRGKRVQGLRGSSQNSVPTLTHLHEVGREPWPLPDLGEGGEEGLGPCGHYPVSQGGPEASGKGSGYPLATWGTPLPRAGSKKASRHNQGTAPQGSPLPGTPRHRPGQAATLPV